MIENELKETHRPGAKPPRGALKKIIEACIVSGLGKKYPKLMERYEVLKKEGAA